MSIHRQKIFKESARFTNTNNMYGKYQNTIKNISNNKINICKYCYRTEHKDLVFLDKKRKKPPSMSLWVSNALGHNVRKKVTCPLIVYQSLHVKSLSRKNPDINQQIKKQQIK